MIASDHAGSDRTRSNGSGPDRAGSQRRPRETASTRGAATLKGLWTRIHGFVNASPLPGFILYVVRRFTNDEAPQSAAGLSYASLLALVPLLAIMLAIVSAFPAFQGVERSLLDLILSDALPPMDAGAGDRIRSFVENATALTGPGIFGLAVTAILLLSNINGAFNRIWRVTEPRSIAVRLLVYWALLTLGPLLLAASISASAPVVAAVGGEDVAEMARWLIPRWVLSIAIGGVGFAVLYFVVPNRRVHVLHAVGGGFVAALVFEVLKAGFALYLAVVPGYELIYGAIAAVPIFLIWLYMSWATVLLGAEVTAALPEWRAYRERNGSLWAGARLALALAILQRLRRARTEGRTLGRRAIVRDLPATPGEVDAVMTAMRRAGLVERTGGGQGVLACDLSQVALARLMRVLDITLAPGSGWPEPSRDVVAALAESAAATNDRDLESLLRDAEARAASGSSGGAVSPTDRELP